MKVKLTKDSIKVLLDTLQEDLRVVQKEIIPWYSEALLHEQGRNRVLREDLEAAQKELENLRAINGMLKEDNVALNASLDIQVEAYNELANAYWGSGDE